MSVWTYIGQIVNFLIFVVILYYLLYRPVGRIMKRRKDEMEAERREAEKTREEAQGALAEADKRAAELEQKRDSVLKEAREQAEAQRKELVKLAEEQGRERLERFRRVMEQERDELLQKVAGELRETIVQVAGAALADVSEALGDRAIDRVGELLDGMSDEDRRGALEALGEAGGLVRVRSGGPLRKDAAARLKKLLTEKLEAKKLDIEVTEDASLIAGIEVTLGHVSLAAHWRVVIDEALEKREL